MLSFFLAFARLARALRRGLRDAETRALLGLYIVLLVGGTMFYHSVEGWSWLDALYFSVMTLATAGAGDLAPQTPLSKVFTMIFMLTGVGVFVGLAAKLASHLLREPRPATDQTGTDSSERTTH